MSNVAGIVKVFVSTRNQRGVHKFPNVVVPPGGSSTDSVWKWTVRLLPEVSEGNGFGTASFSLKRKLDWKNDPRENILFEEKQFICICAAPTDAACSPDNKKSIKWVGRIKQVPEQRLMGVNDSIGFVVAEGLGKILYELYLENFWDTSNRPLQTAPSFNIQSGDTLIGNKAVEQSRFESDPEKFVKTKRVLNSAQSMIWVNKENEPVTDGYWTRLSVLQYVLSGDSGVHSPWDGFDVLMAPFSKLGEDAAANNLDFLNDAIPEAFTINGAMTVGQVLDLLIPRSRGLGWDICYVSDSSIGIYIYSFSKTALTNSLGHKIVNANKPITVVSADHQIIDIETVSESASDRVDKIILEGQNHIFCSSAIGPALLNESSNYPNSNSKSNLRPCWGRSILTTSTAITDTDQHLNESSLEAIYAVGQPALNGTPDVFRSSAEQNASWRVQDYLADVFTLFRVAPQGGHIFLKLPSIKANVNATTQDQLEYTYPMIYVIGDNDNYELRYKRRPGEVLPSDANTAGLGSDASPNIANFKILNWIPRLTSTRYYNNVVDGQAATIEDTGANNNRALSQTPNFDRPRFYEFSVVTNTGVQEVRFKDVYSNELTPTFKIEDFGKFRLTYNQEHALTSKREITRYGDLRLLGSFIIDPRANGIDWHNLVMTYAAESDQKLRIVKYNPAIRDPNPPAQPNPVFLNTNDPVREAAVRATMKIFRDDLSFYMIMKGTVLDNVTYKESGAFENTPLITVSDVVTRNDYPLADRLANEIASFVFLSRTTAKIQLARPDLLPGWDFEVPEGGPAWARIGTFIEKINDAPSTYEINTVVQNIKIDWINFTATIETSRPQMPAFWNATIQSSSPTASPSLGGSLLNTVRESKKEIAKINQRLPDIPVREGATKSFSTLTGQHYYGLVLGGNGVPTSGSDQTDYAYSNQLFNLIRAIPNTEQIEVTKPWADYELPKTYEHGDEPKFYDNGTQIYLPHGLGYIRLTRESGTIDGKSWNADQTEFGSDEVQAGKPVLVAAQVRNQTKLHIFFDRTVNPIAAITNNNYDVLNGIFTFTENLVAPGPASDLRIASYVGYGSAQNELIFNLRVSEDDTEIDWENINSVNMAWLSFVVNQSEPASALDAGNIEMIFQEARNTYLLVANLAYGKTLTRGDFVMVQGVTTITDSDGLAKTIYLVVPGDSTAFRIHRHINDAPTLQGGGVAYPNVLPLTTAGFQGLGLRPA